MNQERKSQLKTLLIEDLDKGMEQLRKELNAESQMMNQAILLSSRYEKLQADDRMGVLSTEQRYLELNRIRMSYLSLVDDLEEEDFKGNEPEVAELVGSNLSQQNCQEFLLDFQKDLQVKEEVFQQTYEQTSTLLVDFGKLFMSIGQVISGLKMEPGKEEEYHQKLQAGLNKSTRRLTIFGQQMSVELEKTKTVNAQIIGSYQSLIDYLDFPNSSTKEGACQTQFKQQLIRLNTLETVSKNLHDKLNFIEQLEMTAYAFKINDELNVAFTKTLNQLKELKAESERLHQQAASLATQLELSIEEMLL